MTCSYLSWLQPLPFTHLQLQIVHLPQLLPDPPQLLDGILLLHDKHRNQKPQVSSSGPVKTSSSQLYSYAQKSNFSSDTLAQKKKQHLLLILTPPVHGHTFIHIHNLSINTTCGTALQDCLYQGRSKQPSLTVCRDKEHTEHFFFNPASCQNST